MSSQILKRSLQLAMHAALTESYEAFEAAVGRLRTIDRHGEVPLTRYLAMEGIAHARAAHAAEAKQSLSRLAELDRAALQEVKRLLLSAPEAKQESFRRFLDEAIPDSESADATTASSGSKKLSKPITIAGVAAAIVVIGLLTALLIRGTPEPAATTDPTVPISESAAESSGDTMSRYSAASSESKEGALYNRMKDVVCIVIMRMEMLLDDGQTVRVPVSAGTGFVACRDGLILTNRHVVDGGREFLDKYSDVVGWDVVVVFGEEGSLILEGGVTQQSTTVDLAWIRVNHEFDQAIEFGPTPAPGQTIMVYGFPGVARDVADAMNLGEFKQRALAIQKKIEYGVEPKLMDFLGPNSMTLIVTSGIISAFHETEEGLMLQTDAFVHSGNSGGPVLDGAGRVVGIATGGSTEVESVNMCLAGRTIHEELARVPGIVWPDEW